MATGKKEDSDRTGCPPGRMADAIAVPTEVPSARYDLRILQAFRQIVRGLDIHSRQLAAEYQITAPQLACLTTIADDGPTTASRIAARVSLSASTVVGILDRLEAKGLIERERDSKDRRIVNVTALEKGRRLIEQAPPLLQEHFLTALRQLSDREQTVIAKSLERVAALMQLQDGGLHPRSSSNPTTREDN